jgi:Flp pilus assembly protein TadG
MVEFALAIVVFMLLVLGTFDVAHAFLAYTVVTNAAREASRYAAAHAADATCVSAAQQAGLSMAIGVDPASLTLTVVCPTPGSGLTYATVNGAYRFYSVTPMVGAVLGSPITMRVATSTLAN